MLAVDLHPIQVLGANAAEAEKLFAGEPETALIAAILWAFEVIKEETEYFFLSLRASAFPAFWLQIRGASALCAVCVIYLVV